MMLLSAFRPLLNRREAIFALQLHSAIVLIVPGIISSGEAAPTKVIVLAIGRCERRSGTIVPRLMTQFVVG